MVQIAGRYEVVESVNFKEMLTRRGIPEDKAQAANDAKTVSKLAVEGQTVTFQPDETSERFKLTFVLGGETEQQTPSGTVKHKAKLDGNSIKVESQHQNESHNGLVTYNFSDTGLEVIFSNDKDSFTAKRVYKRL